MREDINTVNATTGRIYRFINPSDLITFIAEENKIAYAATIIVSNGQAGCETESGDSLECLFMFHPDPMPDIKKYLGEELDTYIQSNKRQIADALDSFAYMDVTNRKLYDRCLSAITDPIKLKEFKDKHEDDKRTSMNRYVARAWQMAEYLRKDLER
ncbi:MULTISPECIES: hypothetical protein [Olivibacter]|uniref:Uncharacterized protein n=1 Tax=Olivibacter jilunii TaxID=985016 RepID=A0ABW6AWH7_9SPHI